MKVYITLHNDKIDLDYRELAEKMWFPDTPEKVLEISHFGDTEMLQEEFLLSLSLDKWLNDERWSDVISQQTSEYISLDRIKPKLLRIETDSTKVLKVDERAFYIMVIEVAKAVQGLISEDKKKTWLTVTEYQKEHQDVLDLSYTQADDISFEAAEKKPIYPWDDHLKVLWSYK